MHLHDHHCVDSRPNSPSLSPDEHANQPHSPNDTPVRDWRDLGRLVLVEAARRATDGATHCDTPAATPAVPAPRQEGDA